MPHRTPPEINEFEISVFGPGYGECILLHIPGGDWIIIDSCIDVSSKQPAALKYLSQIGVDPVENVKLIVATHWHDDHIRGLGDLLQECKNAQFALSGALKSDEFLTLIHTIGKQSLIEGKSGLEELHKAIQTVLNNDKTPILAGEGRCIWSNGDSKIPCRINSLSPSDYAHLQAARDFGKLLPEELKPKKWIVSSIPNINHIAVVLWVQVGPIAAILGSDLEESTSSHSGWSVIVASTTRPPGRAKIFKIPHHGSITGHSQAVWTEMLEKDALSFCTPYIRKTSLPKQSDIDRICTYTNNAYISSVLNEKNLASKRNSVVSKTIKESNIKFKGSILKTGQIRSRFKLNQETETFTVERFNGADHLAAFHNKT